MGLKFMKVKEDDKRFGYKAGDVVLVETNFDWDPDKVICVGKLTPRNDHSFYRENLEKITQEELLSLRATP